MHTPSHTHARGYLTPSVALGDTEIVKNLEETGKFRIELIESS